MDIAAKIDSRIASRLFRDGSEPDARESAADGVRETGGAGEITESSYNTIRAGNPDAFEEAND